MELRQLRYLIAIAEELNFTRAAERCSVSQPPLSRAINQLETELGIKLFDRDTHRVTVTGAGASLIEDARHALRILREGVDKARGITEGVRGTLTIGFGGAPAYELLPELIGSYRQTVLNVEFDFRQMTVTQQVDALRDGDLDIGIVRLPLNDELLDTQFVRREPLMVALPAGHPALDYRGAIPVHRLASTPFVTYIQSRGFNYHSDLLALCRLANFHPIIGHEAPSTEAIIGIVACGGGVALIPASASRLQMRGVTFRKLQLRGLPAQLGHVDLALAWNREHVTNLALGFIRHAASSGLVATPRV